jgi:hypothetical protein
VNSCGATILSNEIPSKSDIHVSEVLTDPHRGVSKVWAKPVVNDAPSVFALFSWQFVMDIGQHLGLDDD